MHLCDCRRHPRLLMPSTTASTVQTRAWSCSSCRTCWQSVSTCRYVGASPTSLPTPNSKVLMLGCVLHRSISLSELPRRSKAPIMPAPGIWIAWLVFCQNVYPELLCCARATARGLQERASGRFDTPSSCSECPSLLVSMIDGNLLDVAVVQCTRSCAHTTVSNHVSQTCKTWQTSVALRR